MWSDNLSVIARLFWRTYLGHPWYPRILSPKELGILVWGTYQGHFWYPRILNIKRLVVLVWGDILGTFLVSWDTKN